MGFGRSAAIGHNHQLQDSDTQQPRKKGNKLISFCEAAWWPWVLEGPTGWSTTHYLGDSQAKDQSRQWLNAGQQPFAFFRRVWIFSFPTSQCRQDSRWAFSRNPTNDSFVVLALQLASPTKYLHNGFLKERQHSDVGVLRLCPARSESFLQCVHRRRRNEPHGNHLKETCSEPVGLAIPRKPQSLSPAGS